MLGSFFGFWATLSTLTKPFKCNNVAQITQRQFIIRNTFSILGLLIVDGPSQANNLEHKVRYQVLLKYKYIEQPNRFFNATYQAKIKGQNKADATKTRVATGRIVNQ